MSRNYLESFQFRENEARAFERDDAERARPPLTADQITQRRQSATLIWRMFDATFDPSRPCGCADCGETEFSPNIEAFEICDRLLCDHCAEAVFEDNCQFGVGA